MEKIREGQSLTGHKETYRVIVEHFILGGFHIHIQKQIKIFGITIWINIKSFTDCNYEDIYDEHLEDVLSEALEIYNKLINTYGKL